MNTFPDPIDASAVGVLITDTMRIYNMGQGVYVMVTTQMLSDNIHADYEAWKLSLKADQLIIIKSKSDDLGQFETLQESKELIDLIDERLKILLLSMDTDRAR